MASWYRGVITAAVPPSTGLAITGAQTTSGTAAAGATTISLTAATTLTGTINQGDSFVISGVTYYATGTATASGNIVAVPVYPAVGTTIAAGTTWSSYTIATYAAGLVSVGGGGQGVCASQDASGVPGAGRSDLLGVTALAASLPSGATLELWLLNPLASPLLLSSYSLYQSAWNGQTLALASVSGALVRVKSGGTAGTPSVFYWAD